MSNLLSDALAERREGSSCLVLGLMSGTSLDGLDIGLVQLRGSGLTLSIEKLIKFQTVPLDPEVRSMIQDLLQFQDEQQPQETDAFRSHRPHPLEIVCKLNAAWARFAGREILAFLSSPDLPHDVSTKSIVVGSHGQTLWHEGHRSPPFSTLQLGDGEILSHVVKKIVVSNFRNTDVGVGGCGAPLVPYFDRILASTIRRWYMRSSSGVTTTMGGGGGGVGVALQNLGGIGNVTYCLEGCSPIAFDTGPANVILNELLEVAVSRFPARLAPFIQQSLPSTVYETPCDWGGVFSARGKVQHDLLGVWCEQHSPFLRLPPPKSTGREVFGSLFVEKQCLPILSRASDETIEQTLCDLCRTAVVFTARTIAFNYKNHLHPPPSVVALSGGGASNPVLVDTIRSELQDAFGAEAIVVTSLSRTLVDAAGSDWGSSDDAVASQVLDDAKEAIAFAVLAHEKLNELAGVFHGCDGERGTNVLSATGAKCSAVLGQLSIPTV